MQDLEKCVNPSSPTYEFIRRIKNIFHHAGIDDISGLRNHIAHDLHPDNNKLSGQRPQRVSKSEGQYYQYEPVDHIRLYHIAQGAQNFIEESQSVNHEDSIPVQKNSRQSDSLTKPSGSSIPIYCSENNNSNTFNTNLGANQNILWQEKLITVQPKNVTYSRQELIQFHRFFKNLSSSSNQNDGLNFSESRIYQPENTPPG